MVASLPADAVTSPPAGDVLVREGVRLAQHAHDKWDALRQSGALLEALGAVDEGYADAILERERQISTYMGEGVSIPHGTDQARALVRRTALGFLQYPDGVDWDGETVYLCIPIAASGDEHVGVLSALAEVLVDGDSAAALRSATDIDQFLALLNAAHAADADGNPRMKVARFYAPGDIRIEETPVPAAGPAEIKIRVRACSTCGTDVKIFHSGHQRIDPPRIIGHEVAGEIVEIGADVGPAGNGRPWRIGDGVQTIAAVPCGQCPDCLRGWNTICPNQTSIGYQYEGGFAEYLIVPHEVLRVDGLNKIPDGVGFDEASMAEPFACAINAQELARVGPGDDVVVIGAGPIGCLHVRLARARGAARVFLVELSRQRLDLSASVVEPDAAICGSEVDPVEAILELTKGRGVDVAITAAASGKAQEDALRMLARRGRLSLFGGLPKDKPTITLNSNLVHYSELTVVGVNGSSPDHNKQALAYMASGEVPVSDLITHRLPLDKLLDGIGIVERGEGIKVVIQP
jgi:L-iditol 2-dehydrogenase